MRQPPAERLNSDWQAAEADLGRGEAYQHGDVRHPPAQGSGTWGLPRAWRYGLPRGQGSLHQQRVLRSPPRRTRLQGRIQSNKPGRTGVFRELWVQGNVYVFFLTYCIDGCRSGQRYHQRIHLQNPRVELSLVLLLIMEFTNEIHNIANANEDQAIVYLPSSACTELC